MDWITMLYFSLVLFVALIVLFDECIVFLFVCFFKIILFA